MGQMAVGGLAPPLNGENGDGTGRLTSNSSF